MKIRLKTLKLLLACFYLFAVQGKSNKKPSLVKKILIVQNAKLGDMVCTTPMFSAVKEKYPDCMLVVAGNKTNSMLLAGHPCVDKYILWESDTKNLVGKIKEEEFDFACTTGPDFGSLSAIFLAGIPLISAPKVIGGYSPYETKSYRMLRSLVVDIPHHMGQYASREYLRLLEPIGIFSNNTKKTLSFSNDAEKFVDEFWIKNGLNDADLIVGISPSAGNKVKMWPEDRFALLSDYLVRKHGSKVVMLGNSTEKDTVMKVINFSEEKDQIVDASGVFGIDELKCAISKLDMFISVDTGPIYIAEAFNIPTIDIVGPMDEHEQPPQGEKHIVVSARKNGEKPQLHIMNARVYDEAIALSQALRITAEQVCEAADKLLS